MARYEAVYDHGIGVPIMEFSGNQKDVIRKAKSYGVSYRARYLTIYYGSSNKCLGSWRYKNGKWYREEGM